MAQLRDDLKYPVKELSRSLVNPQDQDVKNLVHLLKYVNQTRDFVFVMEPQLPVRNQDGKFPVQVISYSDSDWAGCQKSRRSELHSIELLISDQMSDGSGFEDLTFMSYDVHSCDDTFSQPQ